MVSEPVRGHQRSIADACRSARAFQLLARRTCKKAGSRQSVGLRMLIDAFDQFIGKGNVQSDGFGDGFRRVDKDRHSIAVLLYLP